MTAAKLRVQKAREERAEEKPDVEPEVELEDAWRKSFPVQRHVLLLCRKSSHASGSDFGRGKQWWSQRKYRESYVFRLGSPKMGALYLYLAQ